MKKISIALLAMIFLVSCVSFEIGNTEKEMVAKIAARHIGFELNKNYPDIAREVLALSKGILATKDSGETIRIIVDRIVFVLTSETISDPLLVMDIQDLIALLGIRVDVEITEGQMVIIRAVARNLIEGIELEESYGKQT